MAVGRRNGVKMVLFKGKSKILSLFGEKYFVVPAVDMCPRVVDSVCEILQKFWVKFGPIGPKNKILREKSEK